MNKILVFILFFFQSGVWTNKQIDLKEAKELVYLDSNDLTTFSQLRQQLINDSLEIIKQNEKTTTPANRTNWLSTNSFYLNQIDSTKYATLLFKLRGKFVDNILMNRSGNIIFTIKDNVQINDDTYNEGYSHQLISTDCNCSVKSVYNHVDSVYIDSTINGNWKYVFYKVLSGH